MIRLARRFHSPPKKGFYSNTFVATNDSLCTREHILNKRAPVIIHLLKVRSRLIQEKNLGA